MWYIHGLIILLHIDSDDNFIDNDDNIIIDERLNDLEQNSSELIEGILLINSILKLHMC